MTAKDTGVRVMLSPTLTPARQALYGAEQDWADYPEASKMLVVESGALVLYRDVGDLGREVFHIFAPGEWFRAFLRSMIMDADGTLKDT